MTLWLFNFFIFIVVVAIVIDTMLLLLFLFIYLFTFQFIIIIDLARSMGRGPPMFLRRVATSPPSTYSITRHTCFCTASAATMESSMHILSFYLIKQKKKKKKKKKKVNPNEITKNEKKSNKEK